MIKTTVFFHRNNTNHTKNSNKIASNIQREDLNSKRYKYLKAQGISAECYTNSYFYSLESN